MTSAFIIQLQICSLLRPRLSKLDTGDYSVSSPSAASF